MKQYNLYVDAEPEKKYQYVNNIIATSIYLSTTNYPKRIDNNREIEQYFIQSLSKQPVPTIPIQSYNYPPIMASRYEYQDVNKDVNLRNMVVKYFKEKSKMDEGWINGGFFVINPKFLDYIKNDQIFLERKPLEQVTKMKQLAAYRHNGFWQCVDTKRDLILLNKILKSKKGKF
jgi:hypothetical protein